MARSSVGVAVLLMCGGKIWLGRRNAEDRPYFGMFATPGGSMEEGEGAIRCGQREVFEETGLDIDAERIVYGGRTEHVYEDTGVPFSMHWLSVAVGAHEIPMNVEPHKQGPWMLVEVDERITPTLTPGTQAALAALRARVAHEQMVTR